MLLAVEVLRIKLIIMAAICSQSCRIVDLVECYRDVVEFSFEVSIDHAVIYWPPLNHSGPSFSNRTIATPLRPSYQKYHNDTTSTSVRSQVW